MLNGLDAARAQGPEPRAQGCPVSLQWPRAATCQQGARDGPVSASARMTGWGLVLRKPRAADGCVPTSDGGGTDQSEQQTMPCRRRRRHVLDGPGRYDRILLASCPGEAATSRLTAASAALSSSLLPVPSYAARNIGTWVSGRVPQGETSWDTSRQPRRWL